MTAETAKKRRWFQIHLSTACVVMVFAGLLIWKNLHPNRLGMTVRAVGISAKSALGHFPIFVEIKEVSPNLRYVVWSEIDGPGNGEKKILHPKGNEMVRLEYLSARFGLPYPMTVYAIAPEESPTQLHKAISRLRDSLYDGVWIYEGIFVNTVITLAILAATAFACEWWIRRREPKLREKRR